VVTSVQTEVELVRYILKHLALIVPTLPGIITLNFFIVQLAPGGPVDQMIAKISGEAVSVTSRIAGTAVDQSFPEQTTQYSGAEGIDPAMIKELEKQFGFDRPLHERYFHLLWNYSMNSRDVSGWRSIPPKT
jgi:microcin C transport system permease protein